MTKVPLRAAGGFFRGRFERGWRRRGAVRSPGSSMAFFGMLEQVADAFADLGAAGFAQDFDFAAGFFQPLTQKTNLRGFAAAFGAFEGEEEAGVGDGGGHS
jgi:hypothetical protein